MHGRSSSRGAIRALVFAGCALIPALAVAEPACTPADSLVITGLGTWSEEQARLADLAPGVLVPRSGMIRRGGVTTRRMCEGAAVPWGDRYVQRTTSGMGWVVPRLTLAYQATSPAGENDGLLWQGKGISSYATAGVRGRWARFSFQLAPEVAWSQNAPFPIVDTGQPGRLEFANPYYGDGLDLPQRFGAEPYARFAPGQSFVQVEGFGARVGISSENLWWGPGIRHALLLSNNAPGFPHAFLETAEPVDIWIGTLEAQWVVGVLSKSNYAADPDAHPAFSGLALVYQPRWIPGVYVGAGRAFVESWSSLRRHHYLSVAEGVSKSSVGDNPDDNQMLSAWFRWVMPDIELYGEYGQDDFPTFNSFLRQPDRCGLWNLGFQKRLVAGDRWWRVVGELSKTSSNLQGDASCTVYLHGRNADYTNEGQLLGDWMGPGADSQYLGVDVFTRTGRFGGYFERVRRNQEVFWRIRPTHPDISQDVQILLGVRQVLFTPRAEISWSLGVGHYFNRDFVRNESLVRAGLSIVPVLASP